MKILLVIPTFQSYKYRRRGIPYTMPVGSAYINAALREAGLDVNCLNLNLLGEDCYSVLAQKVIDDDIDYVLCGGISPFWQEIKNVFDTVKKAKPSVTTIGGGGLFTAEPLIAAESTGADFAVIGEGEITDVELLQVLINHQDVSKVRGIVYKTQDGYKLSPPREQIRDLDSLPFPCYDGFGMEEFLRGQRTTDDQLSFYADYPRMMPMVMGRSCPYQCKFCFHPVGNTYRMRSLDNFFAELDMWMEKYAPTGIFVLDELFSSNAKRVYEFCERIKPYNLKWAVQMRVDIITKELLEVMYDAGCITISYGLESFSQVVLNNMRKNVTTEDMERALELTYEAGIDIQGNFIFGDELEDEHTIYETLRFWFKNPKYGINLAMIGTYPGSGYYQDLVKNQVIQDRKAFLEQDKWEINLTKLSDETYKKYQLILRLIRFYYNPLSVSDKKISIDENGEGIVEAKCVHCGALNRWGGINVNRLNQVYFKLGCRHCYHRNIIHNKERLPYWDTIEYLCRMVAEAKDEHDFKVAIDVLYRFYVSVRDPEEPIPMPISKSVACPERSGI